jgi:superfamily II DNA or RNA helicase
MATGLGKTYLAGFFAGKFKRTLFIAHREEILYQEKRSFGQIMPDRNGGIYNGKWKKIRQFCTNGQKKFVNTVCISILSGEISGKTKCRKKLNSLR